MIAENVKNIRESIAATCYRIGRDPQTVDLIAVSKTFGSKDISVANEAGVRDFGENYVQELVGKRDQLSGHDIHWHFIGHLQTNKVKYIIDWVSLIQSVDSDGLAAEIEKRGSRLGKIVDVLIEVNTSEEATKFGVKPPLAMDLIPPRITNAVISDSQCGGISSDADDCFVDGNDTRLPHRNRRRFHNGPCRHGNFRNPGKKRLSC